MTEITEEPKLKPKEKPHYVNNRQFSESIVVYKLAKLENPDMKLPYYIADCFMKISERLSHASNFVRYTYRDEMVMDGVENCLRAVGNYNIEAATRTGNPNAFSYFTQICYFAFLRRIAKEKKQQDIRTKFIEQMPTEAFIHFDSYDQDSDPSEYVDYLRERIFKVKGHDSMISDFSKSE